MSVKSHNNTQIEHIKRHQWYMGERGIEMTFDEAALDWIQKQYAHKYRSGDLDLD